MTAPEQDWLERLRAQRPADARGGRGSRLWPLLCDVVEACEKGRSYVSESGVTYLPGREEQDAALAALKDEVERDE